MHVVNSDRIDYRMNIRETTCMVEFVGFEASKFCSEFINEKFVSLGPILMGKYKGVS